MAAACLQGVLQSSPFSLMDAASPRRGRLLCRLHHYRQLAQLACTHFDRLGDMLQLGRSDGAEWRSVFEA
ncbi:MAG: hypothetical protein WDW38_008960 [Sanguina aurantia]